MNHLLRGIYHKVNKVKFQSNYERTNKISEWVANPSVTYTQLKDWHRGTGTTIQTLWDVPHVELSCIEGTG